MNDDIYIFPAVKKAASILAVASGWLLILIPVLSLMEIILAMWGLIEGAIFIGISTQFLFYLLLSFLGIFVFWGHNVLLADRGVEVSRWICFISLPFILLTPITTVYTLITRDALLEIQVLFPYSLCIILLQTALFNLPKMAAISPALRWRIALFPFMLMGIAITDFPGMLPIALLFKIAAAALVTGPLFRLASFIPRIISMPEKAKKPTVNE